MDFVGKVMSLLFNMLSRLVIAFIPRSKHLLISWLHSPSTMILEPKKIKSVTVFTFLPSVYHEMIGLDAMILVFWMLSFKPAFTLSSLTFIKSLFSSSLSPIAWCHLLIWGYWYFSQESWFQLVLHPAQRFHVSKVKVKLLSHVQLFATPWAVAYQAPLSMGFSRQ